MEKYAASAPPQRRDRNPNALFRTSLRRLPPLFKHFNINLSSLLDELPKGGYTLFSRFVLVITAVPELLKLVFGLV